MNVCEFTDTGNDPTYSFKKIKIKIHLKKKMHFGKSLGAAWVRSKDWEGFPFNYMLTVIG